ncbi:MAG: HEAT repeat domain-containing protein [Rhodobacterales bacterium]|nr:HEAT repeat domain-containing protein [Rhodobacterales bacterium]
MSLILLVLAVPAGAAEPPLPELSVPELLSNLGSPDENTRLEAIAALGDSGDPRAFDPLLRLATGPAAPGQDRMEAAWALGNLGDRRAVEPLIGALRRDMKDRTGVMMAIIPALGALGDPRAVPVLLDCLTNRRDDWLARESAAEALGAIGDRRAVGHLINAAWMADTRDAAIGALAAIADPAGAEALAGALGSAEDPETRAAAMDGLVAMGPPAVPWVAGLLAPQRREFTEPDVLRAAVEVLGRMDGPAARAALTGAQDDPDPAVADAARQALEGPPEKPVEKKVPKE